MATQRVIVRLLVDFVTGNAKNQAIIFRALPLLRGLMGPLVLPPWPAADFTEEQKAQVGQAPPRSAPTERQLMQPCSRPTPPFFLLYVCEEKSFW